MIVPSSRLLHDVLSRLVATDINCSHYQTHVTDQSLSLKVVKATCKLKVRVLMAVVTANASELTVMNKPTFLQKYPEAFMKP